MPRRKFLYIIFLSTLAASTWGIESAKAVAPAYAPCCFAATSTSFSQIDLSWGAVISDPATTGYTLQRSPDNVSFSNVLVNNTATKFSDTNLSANTVYNYRVYAINADGNGPMATFQIGTQPAPSTAPPTTPGSFTATASSTSEIDLSWTASMSSSSLSYRIERGYDMSNFITLTQNVTSTAYADTNLAAGTTYFYKLSALNPFGVSSFTYASSTTGNVPSAPATASAVPGDGQALIKWKPPLYAGGVILSYAITGSPDGSSTASSTASSAIVSGLTNGNLYYFLVSAVNAIGKGPSQQTNYVTPEKGLTLSDASAAAPSGTSTPTAPVPAPAPAPIPAPPPASAPVPPPVAITPPPVSAPPQTSPAPAIDIYSPEIMNATEYTFTANLSPGASGNGVTHLQERLANEGFYVSGITGNFDDTTKASLTAYQDAWGISATGSLGPLTRKTLNNNR